MDAQLQVLVEKAIKAWPGIVYRGGRNSRAHAAADLVASGKVRRMGDDLFDVNGHHVQAEADICDCEDHGRGAPHYPPVGRLCKHRLAARMYRVWGGERNEALLEFLRRAIAGQAGAWLVYEWDYDSNRRTVRAVELSGRRLIRPYSDELIEFTAVQLRWALEQLGWGLATLPQKERWYDYRARLAPGRGIEINDATFNTHGITPATIERHQWRDEWETEVAVHGNRLGIVLGEAEARRIAQKRAQLQAA